MARDTAELNGSRSFLGIFTCPIYVYLINYFFQYFHYVQQQLAGECSQNVPAKYTALQAQAKESETKLAQISCWPAFTRKNGVDLNVSLIS